MATHSSVLAWRIPGAGEPGGLMSVGSHRVGHDWSDLAAAHRNAAMNIWMQTAQPVGKGFHYLPMRSKLRLRGRGLFLQRYMCFCFFFFSGNLFYKGVLLGLAILLIPRSSLSVKQYHILTVIVNYFKKTLWKVLFLCYYKLGQGWVSKAGWLAVCLAHG